MNYKEIMAKWSLYNWQSRAFSLFKDLRAFMLNVCCGGGKTLVAILIGLYKRLPVIVIAPKSLCDQWKEDLMETGVPETDIFIFDQPAYSKNKERYIREAELWLQN